MTDTDIFSRESLAGYERPVMDRGVLTLVGAGAAGSNIAQTAALLGIGDVRIIDPDVVEPSNLPRSPLLDGRLAGGRHKRFKAKETALAVLNISRAANPLTRFAVSTIEALGLGAIAGSSAVISALDNLRGRAWLADATRLLKIPFIEVGFSGTRGQVSIFPNASAEEPCWRCLHPHVESGGVSCTLYARRVDAEGRVSATQPLAAVLGNIAIAHAVEAMHRRFPLGGRLVQLDIVSANSRTVELAADPMCPGVHRTWDDVMALDVGSRSTVGVVLDAASKILPAPLLLLPDPYLVDAPCAKCGTPVPVGKPAWAVKEPPACRTCRDMPRFAGRAPVVLTTVSAEDGLGSRKARDIGLAAGAVFEIGSRSSAETRVVRLAGTPDDIFVTRRRGAGNASTPALMRSGEGTDSGGG